MITRYSRIPKKRRKPRRGKPTKAETTAVREAVYIRSGGHCELKKSPRCISGRLAWAGFSPYDHGHLVHIRGKGAGGPTSTENCAWCCHHCHLVCLHIEGGNGKIIPAKERHS